MPALATAHSLSRNDGDVWVDKAVTQADSFPLTDADTSARYCMDYFPQALALHVIAQVAGTTPL